MRISPNTNGHTMVADPEWAATIDQSATPGAGLEALARLLRAIVVEDLEQSKKPITKTNGQTDG